MQLVAYGAQDVYLTGNPQITFFKVVYKRHTNFSMEPIEQTFNGNADFGQSPHVHITRNGDLITKMYLRADVPAVCLNNFDDVTRRERLQFAWVRKLGHALIKSVEIQIGGSRIDKHYGNWLNIWYELTHEVGLEDGYAKMIGDIPQLAALSKSNVKGQIKDKYTIYVPLQFWFCRNNGLALPLIALQYHEVRVYFEFRNKHELLVHNGELKDFDIGSLGNVSLLVDYIYLDTEERRRFAQVSHEYLIEQLQTTGEDSVNSNNYKGRLNFNHPSKALFWGLRQGAYRVGKKFIAYNPFNWEAALKEAAEKLIIGQYVMNEDGSLVTDCDECSDNVCEENVFAVEKESGKLDSSSECKTICRLDLSNSKYVVLADGSELRNKVSGNIVVYCDDSNCDKLFVHHVNIVRNDLTIEDLSNCVESFNTDRRNQWIKNLDICVRQHDNYGNNIDGSSNPVSEAQLKLNGHDRFDKLDGNYFNYVQPYQHFANTPSDGINVYSFALKPIEHQPSGAANFSRIDTTELNIDFSRKVNGAERFRALIGDETKIEIFTVNYNVLRIMSGMGGLAYSN
jgi:hypothetical protein